MERNINKENVKRNIATIALVATLVTGGTGLAIEANVDHVHEYCPLCEVLGMEHQARAINSYDKYANYTAHYIPEHIETTTYTTNAIKHIGTNGVEIYTAPAGYSLQGDLAVKTVSTHYDECVEVFNNNNPFDNVISKIYKR